MWEAVGFWAKSIESDYSGSEIASLNLTYDSMELSMGWE